VVHERNASRFVQNLPQVFAQVGYGLQKCHRLSSVQGNHIGRLVLTAEIVWVKICTDVLVVCCLQGKHLWLSCA
jgi:hypothetical protein